MSEPETIHKFALNGREYICHKLPATKGVRLATRLSRLFGDGIIRLLVVGQQKMPSRADLAAVKLDSLVGNLKIFERLDDDSILELQRFVFPYVWLGKQRIYVTSDADLDAKFEGFEMDSLVVLWEAVKFNIGPFLDAVNSRSETEPETATASVQS